jgi:WD40 repeat protein
MVVIDCARMSVLLLALALLPAARLSAASAPRPLALAREATGMAASQDARTAFFVAPITGRPQLWRAPSAGGWPLQLTESGAVSEPQLSPDGKSLVYAADAGGGKADLFLLPAAGGAPRNLTRSPAAESAPRLSPDGRRLAYLSDAPGARQLFLLELAAGASRALTAGAPVSGAPAWSPDGRRLAVPRGGAVLLLDTRRGRSTELATGAEKVLSLSWAPRGGTLLALAESGGKRRLLQLRPGWERPRPIGPEGWDVRKAEWSGGGIVVLRREGKGSALELLPRPGDEPRALTASGSGVEDFAVSPGGGSLLAFLREGPRSLLIARLSLDD